MSQYLPSVRARNYSSPLDRVPPDPTPARLGAGEEEEEAGAESSVVFFFFVLKISAPFFPRSAAASLRCIQYYSAGFNAER